MKKRVEMAARYVLQTQLLRIAGLAPLKQAWLAAAAKAAMLWQQLRVA